MIDHPEILDEAKPDLTSLRAMARQARDLVRCALFACGSDEIEPYVSGPFSVVLDKAVVGLDDLDDAFKRAIDAEA